MATPKPHAKHYPAVARKQLLSEQPISINPLQEIDRLDEALAATFTEYRVTKKNGVQSIVGKRPDGSTVRMAQYTGNGVHERSISTASPLTLVERRAEVKRLRAGNLTQQQIAERLGCSQKTVSNDLDALGLN